MHVIECNNNIFVLYFAKLLYLKDMYFVIKHLGLKITLQHACSLNIGFMK